MAAGALPSESEMDQALAAYLPAAAAAADGSAADTAWRSLVLQVLACGTGCDAACEYGGSSVVPPLELTMKSAELLVNALARFDVQCGDKKSEVVDGSASASSTDAPRTVLADVLWLVGTLLDEGQASASGPGAGVSSPPDGPNSRFEALCALVNSLSYGTSLRSGGDGDGDGYSGASGVPAVPIPVLQRRLEPGLLAGANLLANRSTKVLAKRFTTANTNMYYRQVRFNLLQEESEGWSKLLALLTGMPGSAGGDATGARRRVRELVGAFDLDPNRVLDVTIDVLESEVASLLGGAGAKGAASVVDLLSDAPGSAPAVHMLLRVAAGLKVDSLPHLIGFKYASYAAAGSGSAAAAPRALHLTAALLVLHGLLRPEPLSALLSPTVASLRRRHEIRDDEHAKRIKKMGMVSLNSTAAAEEKKEDGAADGGGEGSDGGASGEHGNQVVSLFRALVEVGAPWDLATSVFILKNKGGEAEASDFDGAEAACSLSRPAGSAVCDWVRRVISPLYDARLGSVGRCLVLSSGKERKRQHKDKGGADNGGHSLLAPAGAFASALSPSASLTELATFLKGPLSAIIASGAIGHDPILYCMLCRLVATLLPGKSDSKTDGNVDIDGDSYALLRTFLVPAMSMFPANPSINAELWSVLSRIPYQTRYGMYGSSRLAGLEKSALRVNPRKKALPVIEAEVQSGIETRYTLKRLSKDNIKVMGRQLSKISHSNPLVVFSAILNQIESYDNLILMMVDTFKHATVLSLDVLGYCLLVALGGGDSHGGRSKLKDDGVNAAQWLSSLETFAGAFYKKFPEVEMHGLLSYLVRRLEQGLILELGVLRNLLKTAGGYGFADCDSTAGLSELQLDGRAGSQLLKRETSDFGVIEKSNRKASMGLRSVLQDADIGAVVLILLSQIRPRILFNTGKGSVKHIKLIGNQYDSCQMVLSVLLDFLTDSTDEMKAGGSQTTINASVRSMSNAISCYASSLPELGELHQNFGIETVVSWALCRPLIRAAMFVQEAKAAVPPHLTPYLPSTDAMKKASSAMLPEICWNYITTELFETFYSHSLYDIHCPEVRYSTEIARLTKEKDRLSQLKAGGTAAMGQLASMAQAAAAAGGNVRDIREATAFGKEHEQDLQRVSAHAEILAFDLKRQRRHCDAVLKKIAGTKESFMSGLNEADVRNNTSQAFLTYCVYPRCLLTPEDSLYCAKFAMLLHSMEAPQWRTIKYVSCLVDAIAGAAYSVTEDEAGNLSILLKETWSTIRSWRDDEKAFAKELAGKPGAMVDDGDDGLAEISFADFKKLFGRWHAILGEALVGCLESSEYIHTRAALILMSRSVSVFPSRTALGERILGALDPLKEDVKRQDIRAMAQGYASQLVKARDEGMWEEDGAAATARREAEKRKAEERKREAEKRFAEMKEDSQAIAREIGDGGRGGGGGSGARGGGVAPGGGMRSPPLNSNAPSFTPAGGGQRRDLRRDSREPPPYDSRGRGPPPPGGDRDRDRGREMGGRWERAGGGGDGRGMKRNRSPSPEHGGRGGEARGPEGGGGGGGAAPAPSTVPAAAAAGIAGGRTPRRGGRGTGADRGEPNLIAAEYGVLIEIEC